MIRTMRHARENHYADPRKHRERKNIDEKNARPRLRMPADLHGQAQRRNEDRSDMVDSIFGSGKPIPRVVRLAEPGFFETDQYRTLLDKMPHGMADQVGKPDTPEAPCRSECRIAETRSG
jgi:hypothetical protein